MLTAVYTILVFCLIIAIHEFGHFAAAKITGMTVHEFSVGMGPRLFSFTTSKTAYSLRALPIGGYVKLEGEDEKSDDINAFCNKKPIARLFVLFSGAFLNFVLGFVLFCILFFSSEGIITNKVGTIIPDSAFSLAGIEVGDEIIKMEGENYSSAIRDYNDVNYFVSKNGMTKTKITIRRNDKVFVAETEPSSIKGYEGKLYGFKPMAIKPNLLNVITASYRQSVFVVKIVISSFADLLTGKISLSNMSGPVGIVNEIGNAAKEGMAYNFIRSLLNVMSLAALISINLGVVNLLPLPALDGGRIFFILLELIRRKPIDKEKEGYVHFIGFALLILLMIAITFLDIGKLIS